jgi:hypothetical protein
MFLIWKGEGISDKIKDQLKSQGDKYNFLDIALGKIKQKMFDIYLRYVENVYSLITSIDVKREWIGLKDNFNVKDFCDILNNNIDCIEGY